MPQSTHSNGSSSIQIEEQTSVADPSSGSTGQKLELPGHENGAASPFRATFSFGKQDRHARSPSVGTDLADENQSERPLKRGAPGDGALMAMVHRDPEEIQQCRRKSSFYGEVFAYRESNTSARERIARESVVMADVKTNIIVRPANTNIAVCRRLMFFAPLDKRRIRLHHPSLSPPFSAVFPIRVPDHGQCRAFRVPDIWRLIRPHLYYNHYCSPFTASTHDQQTQRCPDPDVHERSAQRPCPPRCCQIRRHSGREPCHQWPDGP